MYRMLARQERMLYGYRLPHELVNKMLEIAGVTEKDYLIDLGSGDGRTVIALQNLGQKHLESNTIPEWWKFRKRMQKMQVSVKNKIYEG